jgi:hypothetical protein
MSFRAELTIAGKTVNVLELESARDTDIIQWMVSPDEKRDGAIIFKRRDGDSSLRTVQFTEGICVQFHETFHHSGTNPMTTHIVISARELKIGNVQFNKKWEEH